MAKRLLLAFVLPLLLLWVSADRAEAQAPAVDQPDVSPRAAEILRRSMDFVSAAPAFRVTGESGNEVLHEDGQLLEFGADDFVLAIQRPSKANLRIESRDGAAATLLLDGKTMSVHTVFQDTFYYDTTEQPGDIAMSFHQVAAELGVPRLVRAFRSKELTGQLDTLISGYYVGEAFIDDIKCDHLAFRQDNRDVQLWIAQGAEPVPRRIVIRHRLAEGQPREWVEMTDWDLSPEPTDEMFRLTIPPQAERANFFSGSPK